MDDHRSSPQVKEVAPAALVLALIGWVGLYWLTDSTLPTLIPRWLFFFCFVLAICGTSLPFVAYFHRRFPSQPPASLHTVVRQSLWISVYLTALLWMQIARILTSTIIILVGVGIIAIEWLLRFRERSQWKP